VHASGPRIIERKGDALEEPLQGYPGEDWVEGQANNIADAASEMDIRIVAGVSPNSRSNVVITFRMQGFSSSGF
jgi:hypothetical protein